MLFTRLTFGKYDPSGAALATARLRRVISVRRGAQRIDAFDERYTTASGEQGEFKPLYDASVYRSSSEQLAGMLDEVTKTD